MELRELLQKPLWQMTGSEFLELVSASSSVDNTPSSSRTLCTGVHALAEYLRCCDATVYTLKREGVLDEAIVSRVGKRIVFDGEKARHLADKFLKRRRGGNE